jgi:TonB family protein
MLHVLLESGARSTERRARWTAASVLTHMTLIAAAVALTMRDGHMPIERIELEPVVYVAPQPTSRLPLMEREPGIAPVAHEMLSIPVPMVPQVNPSIVTEPGPLFLINPTGAEIARSISSTVLPGDGVYTEQRVDRIVVPRNGNGQPAYPSQLRLSGIDGDVLVRFVVDSAGRVEPASITIIQATHALFATAVRQWLLRTRYAPAELLGRPVRQLVEQRVAFMLRP